MTPEQLYQLGYDDGKAGKAANVAHVHEDNYEMGYQDGKGDRDARPVADEYFDRTDPPVGFTFTGEKRTPEPGEWYVSKNGNAIQAKKVRGNNQTRHILLPD
jgi:hypothetical protein